MISFPCPDCSGAIQHDSSLAGCMVACPHCHGSLLMPPAACALDVGTGIDPQAGVLDRAGGVLIRAAGVLARHLRCPSRMFGRVLDLGLWIAISMCAVLLAGFLIVWFIGLAISEAESEAEVAVMACPLKPTSAGVRSNFIGTPVAWLSVTNLSTQNVLAYRVFIECFDRFDEPALGFFGSSNVTRAISQNTIRPGESDSVAWSLSGHDNMRKIRLTITAVKMEDGSEWTPSKGQSIFIEGQSPDY